MDRRIPVLLVALTGYVFAVDHTNAQQAIAPETTANVLPQRGICAHRGASATHPENTLAALREAVRLGAHMMEFDVALTKDEQVVLMHDLTVDRTTTGSGKLSGLTLVEVKALDAGSWHGEKFIREKVPTLVEALEMMPSNIWLNVHLKGGSLLAEKTTRELRITGRLHQAFLACGQESAAAARKIVPDVRVCNMDRKTRPALYVETTLRQKAEFIQLLGRQPGSLEQVALLREHQVRVNWCCTNDPAQLRKLFTAGVEFVLVDEVESMLEVAEEVGIERNKPTFRIKIGRIHPLESTKREMKELP